MNKICTTIEQSKKLIELGIDVNTADMCYHGHGSPLESEREYDSDACPFHSMRPNWDVPAWSLSALLELMPSKVNHIYKLHFIKDDITNGYYYSYKERISKRMKAVFASRNPLDAAFEMVVWLLENGLIKTE